MNKNKQVAAIVLGLLFLICVGSIYKWVFKPRKEAEEQVVKSKEAEEKVRATGSQRHYDYSVNLALDGFSGYSVFRSSLFRNLLSAKSIQLDLADDGANYLKRLERLKTGEVQMAVFTIDALLKASAQLNDLPATIVLIIDESGNNGYGADALVAYKSKYPSIDSMNNSETRFVLVPDSPSEMMVRVMLSSFELGNVRPDCFIKVDSPNALFNYYRKAKPDDNVVYAGWEPTIGKILQNPNTHNLANSSNFQGYIVDVLVVNRDFLIKYPKVVKDFVAEYLRASYKYQDQMSQLVLEDAKLTGETLNAKQAEGVAKGIKWRNTLENYAAFGIQPSAAVQNIEDIIKQINDVLLRSKAIASDPVKGKPNLLYYNQILKDLIAEGFHPGSTADSDGMIQSVVEVKPLTEEQWTSVLRPVASLQTEEIVFAPGTARLTEWSSSSLQTLATNLKKWPMFYVKIQGTPRTSSNPEAAKTLAQKRAQAVADQLISLGIDPNRIKAMATEPGKQAKVSCVLGQIPY